MTMSDKFRHDHLYPENPYFWLEKVSLLVPIFQTSIKYTNTFLKNKHENK